MTSMVSTE